MDCILENNKNAILLIFSFYYVILYGSNQKVNNIYATRMTEVIKEKRNIHTLSVFVDCLCRVTDITEKKNCCLAVKYEGLFWDYVKTEIKDMFNYLCFK